MSKLWILVKGELQRLNKYNVFSTSIFIAMLWALVLLLIDAENIASFLPIILMADATLLSIMYMGAITHYEKTESTMSTMLVSPISNKDLVTSKLIAHAIHNMFSAILLIAVFILLRDVDINVALVMLGVLLATVFFTVLGVCLSYFQKDFTTMLMSVLVISFTMMVPTILFQFDILTGEVWETILLFNPVSAAKELIDAGFGDYEFTYTYWTSFGYMLVGAVVLFTAFAVPRFHSYAIKSSGV